MSLQIWLPLTKDLRQQGLASVTVTNSGATYQSTGGKLGGCYYFDGTNDYITFVCQEFPTILAGNFSIAFWIYSDDDGTRSVYFGNYGISGGGNWFNLEKHTANEIRFWWNNGSPDKRFNSTHILASDGWVHFTLTKGNGIVNTYLNGQLIETYTNQNLSVAIPSTATTFRIGGDSRTSGDLMFKGKMNDFRVYDHCLSPMEVKELAKGLVLHYPLDRQGWGQENLLLNSSIEKTGASNSAQWFRWNVANPMLSSNHTYTLSFDAKMSNNTDVFYIGWANADSTQITMQEGVRVTDEYKRYSFTGQTTKTNINSFVISNYKGYGRGNGNNTTGVLSIKNIKLEEGTIATPWCPNSADTLATTMGLNSTIEYDCSGFCNNGDKFGIFNWTSDTPKYAVSTNFPSGSNYINAGRGAMVKDSITVSLWCKYTTWGNPISCTEGGGWNFENNSSYITFSLYVSGVGYKVVRSTKTPDNLKGEWHMLTGVFNKIQNKIYIDGELEGTVDTDSTNGISYNANNAILIAAEASGTQAPAQTNFVGNISDLRIYATALSADDVKSLYQNCATIDPDGTIRGQIRS